MNEVLERLRDIIQEDPGQRGLRAHPTENLIAACADDFSAACRALAGTAQTTIAIVTGFFIPTGRPPAGETDGPLGAVFFARALAPLGIRVILASDAHTTGAIAAGLEHCGLGGKVPVLTLPAVESAESMGPSEYRRRFAEQAGPITHLVALERVGPCHGDEGCGPGKVCFSMRGRDVTPFTSPAHWLFEEASVPTIGIGDGGNEIGMGKIDRAVIGKNVCNGQQIACRVATDHLVVCGISNWGAYALAAGVRWLRRIRFDGDLFNPDREERLLQVMVDAGPLIDGVSGLPTATVDGLPFERYAESLRRIGHALAEASG